MNNNYRLGGEIVGAFIVRQPNGLYCRFSTVVDCPTDWNMTEQDYIDMKMETAKEEAIDTLKNHVKDFSMVKDRFRPTNMTRGEWDVFLNEVGGK